MLPYWADSLDKSVKVARHIFYRLKGSLGSAAAFRQRHAGYEPMPPPPTTAEAALDSAAKADELLALAGEAPKAEVLAGELAAATEPVPQLVAEATAGKLILVEGISSEPAYVRLGAKPEACPYTTTWK